VVRGGRGGGAWLMGIGYVRSALVLALRGGLVRGGNWTGGGRGWGLAGAGAGVRGRARALGSELFFESSSFFLPEFFPASIRFAEFSLKWP
jgi:hypothetical protein